MEMLPVLVALILSLVTLIVTGLKEFKSSDVVLVPEKSTIMKVFAQQCKECYKV
jgi:hypothetical protein